jgi:hypothetical protein
MTDLGALRRMRTEPNVDRQQEVKRVSAAGEAGVFAAAQHKPALYQYKKN